MAIQAISAPLDLIEPTPLGQKQPIARMPRNWALLRHGEGRTRQKPFILAKPGIQALSVSLLLRPLETAGVLSQAIESTDDI